MYWTRARTQIKNPNAMISHHSQEFSCDARSVEFFTINVHLASERPKPDRAPYRAAIVWQKHVSIRKPIQLKRNATRKAVTNMMSVPRRLLSVVIFSVSVVSIAMKVRPGVPLRTNTSHTTAACSDTDERWRHLWWRLNWMLQRHWQLAVHTLL